MLYFWNVYYYWFVGLLGFGEGGQGGLPQGGDRPSFTQTYHHLGHIKKIDFLDLHYKNIFVIRWWGDVFLALNYKVIFQKML